MEASTLMIRFAYFDAGGTLLTPYPSVGEVYAAAGRAHGLTATAPELQRAFRAAWKKANSLGGQDETSSRVWWRAIVDDVFDAVAYHGDRRACFDAFFEAFVKKEAWHLHDDVRPALEALTRANIRCGVLSNWDYRLHALLDAFELSGYFEQVLISAEVGLAKPDPRIFDLAIARSGARASEILYAGDDLDLDVAPAAGCGLHAYLIDRTGAHSGHAAAITRLTDLSTIAAST